jgi:hypothetical protein
VRRLRQLPPRRKFSFPNPTTATPLRSDFQRISRHRSNRAYNKNILVDAVRDLEKEANYRPYEAKARFFIVDDADKMNDAASNALLKPWKNRRRQLIYSYHFATGRAFADDSVALSTMRFAPIPARTSKIIYSKPANTPKTTPSFSRVYQTAASDARSK